MRFIRIGVTKLEIVLQVFGVKGNGRYKLVAILTSGDITVLWSVLKRTVAPYSKLCLLLHYDLIPN